jgi:hypothetical protein
VLQLETSTRQQRAGVLQLHSGSSRGQAPARELVTAAGLGGGASGAAAGLLHPFSPKGRPVRFPSLPNAKPVTDLA